MIWQLTGADALPHPLGSFGTNHGNICAERGSPEVHTHLQQPAWITASSHCLTRCCACACALGPGMHLFIRRSQPHCGVQLILWHVCKSHSDLKAVLEVRYCAFCQVERNPDGVSCSALYSGSAYLSCCSSAMRPSYTCSKEWPIRPALVVTPKRLEQRVSNVCSSSEMRAAMPTAAVRHNLAVVSMVAI